MGQASSDAEFRARGMSEQPDVVAAVRRRMGARLWFLAVKASGNNTVLEGVYEAPDRETVFAYVQRYLNQEEWDSEEHYEAFCWALTPGPCDATIDVTPYHWNTPAEHRILRHVSEANQEPPRSGT